MFFKNIAVWKSCRSHSAHCLMVIPCTTAAPLLVDAPDPRAAQAGGCRGDGEQQ